MTENYRKYQILLCKMHQAMMFGTDEECEKIRDKTISLWPLLSEEEMVAVEQLSEDLFLIHIPELEDIKSKKLQIMKLKKIIRGYEKSFELYRKATQELDKLYPHPNPLTHRDISQICVMASKEVKRFRKILDIIKEKESL